MEPVPYEVMEAMIQCFGLAFHYKDPMAAFLVQAGVSRELVNKHRDEKKFPWARKILTELSQSDEGRLIQRKVLMALYHLRNLPDSGVEDKDAGLNALRILKSLAKEYDLVVREERQDSAAKLKLAEEKAKILSERAAKLHELRRVFNQAFTDPDRQGAGYSLENLLADLFRLSEIEYKKSFRTPTQQIDGHFKFEGFDYLLEARWRTDMPTEAEIGGFQRKVNSKLESTRGIFVSVPGFRSEVISQFNGQGANIILVDGEHLTHILEGRIELREALKIMIETAAQKGVVFTKLF